MPCSTRRRRASVPCRFATRLIGRPVEEVSGGGSVAVTSGRNAVFLGAAPFNHIAAHDLAGATRLEWGARPPRALPTAPSPLAFRREAPDWMFCPLGEEFGAGRAEQQPRRLRSPFL